MSFYSSVFVGPYLTLAPVERERECRTRGCSANPDHPTPNAKAHFCMLCGAPVVESTKLKREVTGLLPHQLPDEFTDWMWMPESLYRTCSTGSIWLPNHTGYSLDLEEGSALVELTPAVIDDYLQRFNTHYKRLLDYLESTYPGAQSVKFGAVPYSH